MKRWLILILVLALCMVPAAALDGVVANQRLLARHHAAVRNALAEKAR